MNNDTNYTDTDKSFNSDSLNISYDDINSNIGWELNNIVIGNRYLLIQKIGYGSFSSVWISYDLFLKNIVACKIYDRNETEYAEKEIKILKNLYNNNNFIQLLDYTYFFNVFEMQNDYDLDNKKIYVALIIELLSCDLQHVFNLLKNGKIDELQNNGLNIDIIHKIIKDMIFIVNDFHIKTNMIHTDIKPDNFLIRCKSDYCDKIKIFFNDIINVDKIFNDIVLSQVFNDIKCINNLFEFEKLNINIENIENLSIILNKLINISTDRTQFKEFYLLLYKNKHIITWNLFNYKMQEFCMEIKFQFFNYVNKLEKHNILYFNNKTEFDELWNIISNNFLNISYNLDFNNLNIILSDFGNAINLNNYRDNFNYQIREYRAPEIILKYIVCQQSDFWSLGCIIYELLTGKILFDIFDDIEIYDNNINNNANLKHIFMINNKVKNIDNNLINSGNFDEEDKKYIKNNKNLFYLKKSNINICWTFKEEFINLANKNNIIISKKEEKDISNKYINIILALLEPNIQKRKKNITNIIKNLNLIK